MSNNIVFLTSAVYTNYGIYSAAERIQQTLETANSAKQYIPDCKIILIDNSKVDVQTDTSAELEQLIDAVDYYVDNSEDSDIRYFHQNVANYDVGKNVMEAMGLFKTMVYIHHTPEMSELIKNSRRVFKLSGRYKVTDKFDINNFDNANTQGKYVFKKAQPSWISPEDTGVTQLYQTRLWSFSSDLFFPTIEMYQKIIENMINLINQKKYIDNEHSMAKFLPKDKLVELDTVGLMGNIAPNGMIIID